MLLPGLSKDRPDCLVARDIEVEFVNFGRSLPQMLDATSTSKSTKAIRWIMENQENQGSGALRSVNCPQI
jgi:hypothetical protein